MENTKREDYMFQIGDFVSVSDFDLDLDTQSDGYYGVIAGFDGSYTHKVYDVDVFSNSNFGAPYRITAAEVNLSALPEKPNGEYFCFDLYVADPDPFFIEHRDRRLENAWLKKFDGKKIAEGHNGMCYVYSIDGDRTYVHHDWCKKKE